MIARIIPKKYDIGLGPEPLINNIYHKKALEKFGYKVETFVSDVYFITDNFDKRADLLLPFPLSPLRYYYLFILCIFRYRCLYLYFSGGPLYITTILWRLEPFLYKLAGIKTVVMPYGHDVQDLTRCPNLLFKDAKSKDYPSAKYNRKRIEKKIDLWTEHASFIIAGADWVDYLYYWDRVMLAHFSIDTDVWGPTISKERGNLDVPFRILHAPNHPSIKGTSYFEKAVEELQLEGCPIELVHITRVSNERIKELMRTVDAVADQLIIGWYAMFALEGMAMEKPVLCYIREDLEKFYISKKLLEKNELPIIKCSPENVKEVIKNLIVNRTQLTALGKKSRQYVINHHSLPVIGKEFFEINISLGIFPSGNDEI